MRHEKALRILVAALLLGIAADQLLRYIPPGANVLIWTALFIGCAALLGRVALLPALGALAAASGLVWRTIEPLVALDVLLLALFLPMLALNARGVRTAVATMTQLVTAQLTTAFQTIAGVPQLLLSDLEWSVPRHDSMRGAGVIVRGVLFALPPLIVFSILLSSADASFARVFTTLFDLDLSDVVRHVLVTAIVATICTGFLRSLVLSGEAPAFTAPAFLRLPIAEATIALGLVDLLFATFVALQARYLFLGAEAMNASAWARRGFFELVAVVMLVVPMLLAVEWLATKSAEASRLLAFRIVAGVQVALVLVIAASAWRRLQLYRDEYGLTRDRVMPAAFMIWLAVVLVWLAATVLTGRRERFAAGALVTGIIATVALHAINPDELIVRTNLARAAAGRRPFDAVYASRLSDDAAPIILANARSFDAKSLDRFVKRERTIGWRTWNLSRARAIEAVRAYESKATPPIGRP